MARYDLSDKEWAVIAPLLPNKPRGVPRVDDRRVLNAIFWRIRAGAPWRGLRDRYGPTRQPTTATIAGGRPASGIGFSTRWRKPAWPTPA